MEVFFLYIFVFDWFWAFGFLLFFNVPSVRSWLQLYVHFVCVFGDDSCELGFFTECEAQLWLGLGCFPLF